MEVQKVQVRRRTLPGIFFHGNKRIIDLNAFEIKVMASIYKEIQSGTKGIEENVTRSLG